jgi:hypothetical protein
LIYYEKGLQKVARVGRVGSWVTKRIRECKWSRAGLLEKEWHFGRNLECCNGKLINCHLIMKP